MSSSRAPRLAGRRVALLVTGGIAAMKIPFVGPALRSQGASVVAFTSQGGDPLRHPGALEWSTVNPVVQRLTAAAEHLSDGAPFDAYLLAPATYNSINKNRRRRGRRRGHPRPPPRRWAGSSGAAPRCWSPPPCTARCTTGSSSSRSSASTRSACGVVPPRDAYGKHNLPDERVLVAEVCRAVSRSPLRGRRILVTGGTTPVPIDGVAPHRQPLPRPASASPSSPSSTSAARTPCSSTATARSRCPGTSPTGWPRTYDDYPRHRGRGARPWLRGRRLLRERGRLPPVVVAEGKIPSGQDELTLTLVPTVKVVEEVREAHPDLYMVTFEYQEGLAHEGADAGSPLPARPLPLRGGQSRRGAAGPPVAGLDGDARRRSPPRGRQAAIAEAIADHLERALSAAR